MRASLLSFFILIYPFILGAAIHWSSPQILEVNKTSGDFSLHHKSCLIASNKQGEFVLGYVDQEQHEIYIFDYYPTMDRVLPYRLSLPCQMGSSLLRMHYLNNQDLFLLIKDEVSSSVHACKFDQSNEDWSSGFTLQADQVSEIDLFTDEKGNALLVWVQFDGYMQKVEASYYSTTTNSWTSPFTLSPVGHDCHAIRAACDRQGHFVIAWVFELYGARSKDKPLQGIEAARLDPRKPLGESAAFLSESSPGIVMENPQLIFDAKDHLIISWELTNTFLSSTHLQYLHFDAQKQKWGNKVDVLSPSQPKHSRLVISGENVYALWKEQLLGKESLQSLQLKYPAGVLPEIVQITPAHPSYSDFVLKADSHGKMSLAATRKEGIELYRFEETWKEVALFNHQKYAAHIQVEVDPLGNALLIWEKEGDWFYSRGNYLLPPANLVAKKVEIRFAAKKVYRVQLNWDHPESPDLVSYKIRKNGLPIAELAPSQTKFIDRYPFSPYTVYSITSLHANGLESQSTEIIISP